MTDKTYPHYAVRVHYQTPTREITFKTREEARRYAEALEQLPGARVTAWEESRTKWGGLSVLLGSYENRHDPMPQLTAQEPATEAER